MCDANANYNTHTGEKPPKCTVFNNVLSNSEHIFVYYYAYRDNILDHNEDKPTECNICDKLFVNYVIRTNDNNTTMCDVNASCNSHTGEKPTKCTVCDKVFVKYTNKTYDNKTTMFDVNANYFFHTGEKPPKCHVLNNVLLNSDHIFVYYYAYRDNIFDHNKDKPAKCNVCDKVFVMFIIKTNDNNTTMSDVNVSYISHTREKIHSKLLCVQAILSILRYHLNT